MYHYQNCSGLLNFYCKPGGIPTNQRTNKDYTALMRTFLTTQKAYLQLVAEDKSECTEKDALLAFTATA